MRKFKRPLLIVALIIAPILFITGGVLFILSNGTTTTNTVISEPINNSGQKEAKDNTDNASLSPESQKILNNSNDSTANQNASIEQPVYSNNQTSTLNIDQNTNSTPVQQCSQDLVAAYVGVRVADISSENSYHSSRLQSIASEWSNRGLLYSGGYQQDVAYENSRHDGKLQTIQNEYYSKMAAANCTY